VPLYFGANSRGALEMGVLGRNEDGGKRNEEEGLRLADVLTGSKRPKVIYLVGDVPFLERPDCDFLIVQDTYLPPFKVDAFLPAATFAESGGTLINMEGRVQQVVQIENPLEGPVTGFMRPDWQILSDLAKTLQYPGMDYHTFKDVGEDIHRAVPDFPTQPDRMPRRMIPADRRPLTADRSESGAASRKPSAAGEFLLVAEPAGYRHRGVDIGSKVGGLTELAFEEGFRMNPEDFAALGLAEGDEVTVTIGSGDTIPNQGGSGHVPNARVTASGPAKPNRECPKGVIYYTRPFVFGGLGHRRALWPLYRLSENPVRASIRKA